LTEKTKHQHNLQELVFHGQTSSSDA